MERVAIIGAGISGLTVAQLLKEKYEVRVFEKESTPGGLIRCKRVDGNLYHLCGGHVFNSKKQEVLDWFWSHFDRETEFLKANRNSVVFMENDKEIPYPIENHAYLFDRQMMDGFIDDLITLARVKKESEPANFEEFLRGRFGETLYNAYFRPYNEKVWRRDLKQVPLSWLEGKLPMPTVKEMIYNNINRVKEKQFVHSTFWNERNNGSQFIANRLAEGLNIVYNSEIKSIEGSNGTYILKGQEFNKVVFCGNIKCLPAIAKGKLQTQVKEYLDDINSLESHGTTSVFCDIESNPYSWIYMPSPKYQSHRIICTGNFASTNNATNRMTATVEFTDRISKKDILDNLSLIPLKPRYLSHYYNEYTYPIQNQNTRNMINSLKNKLFKENFYMTGRFADWEYYNMDVAMGAAMELCKLL